MTSVNENLYCSIWKRFPGIFRCKHDHISYRLMTVIDTVQERMWINKQNGADETKQVLRWPLISSPHFMNKNTLRVVESIQLLHCPHAGALLPEVTHSATVSCKECSPTWCTCLLAYSSTPWPGGVVWLARVEWGWITSQLHFLS